MTIEELVDAYVSDPEKAALRSIREMARRLRRNVVPKIGAVALSQLRRRDVRNVTEALTRRGAATEAARVFEDVHAMLRWGVDHEYLDHSPIEGMTKPAGGKPRERVLTDGEIATLWSVLPSALPRSRQCQEIIRLCLLTGQRVGEVAGLTRDELDLKAREWKLPGRRTKNGHAHTVPLTDMDWPTRPVVTSSFHAGKGTSPAPRLLGPSCARMRLTRIGRSAALGLPAGRRTISAALVLTACRGSGCRPT
jgi:integrase